jgi:hypothetical protein
MHLVSFKSMLNLKLLLKVSARSQSVVQPDGQAIADLKPSYDGLYAFKVTGQDTSDYLRFYPDGTLELDAVM